MNEYASFLNTWTLNHYCLNSTALSPFIINLYPPIKSVWYSISKKMYALIRGQQKTLELATILSIFRTLLTHK